jgi:hypothetical protein
VKNGFRSPMVIGFYIIISHYLRFTLMKNYECAMKDEYGGVFL